MVAAALVKVRFSLERDEDGWPPAESEGLWAEPLGDDLFRIDNTPWFVLDLASDDVVRAVAAKDGQLWAQERVMESGRMTVRVACFSEGDPDNELQRVLDLVGPFRVSGEGYGAYRMVALDIGPTADLSGLKRLLAAGVDDGTWAFEEGCVSSEWLAL